MIRAEIAVIDHSVNGLFLYTVPVEIINDSDAIEEVITSQGRHLSNCSWGIFDGEIVDLRNND